VASTKTLSTRWTVAIRLSVWLTFGVVFGLLPLLISLAKEGMSPDGLHLADVLGHGELMIVGAVIAAGALGEFVADAVIYGFADTSPLSRLGAAWLWFFTALALVASTVAYMIPADPTTVTHVSLWLFPVALVPSGVTIAVVAS